MRRISILTGCLVLVVVGVALATAPDGTATATRTAGPSTLEQRTAAVRLVLDEQRVLRAALEQEYLAATDETTALEVQERMEELARTTEWRILGIQAAYLRVAGRLDEAKAIEDAVKQMQAPPEKRTPVARPRPDADSGAR
jgi:hypothetical protein